MKKFTGILLFLFLLSPLSATIYYVDTNADPGGDGTTQALTGANCAWDAVADVNAATFSAGDVIKFNKGCTWREKLTVPDSGSSGSQVTFGYYGTGNKPKLLGSIAKNATTDWTLEEGDGSLLYSDGFESGDLTGWDGNTEVGSSTIVAHADATFMGSYGGKFTIVAGDDVYLSEDDGFTAQTTFRHRVYINFDSLTMADEDMFALVQYKDEAGTLNATLNLEYESGANSGYYLNLKVLDDGPSWVNIPGVDTAGWKCNDDPNILDGEWHCIEIYVKSATGAGANDGIGQLFVDGTSRASDTTIDSDTRDVGEIDVLGAKLVDAGTDGVIYIDNAVVDSAAIGQARLWYASPGAETRGLVFDSEASKSTEVENKADLNANGKSWWDDTNSREYVYYLETNPATAYSGSIECQIFDFIIDTNDKSYLTFDGLDLRYTGKAAISDDNSATADTDIVIQNCAIKYCGTNLSLGAQSWGRAIIFRVTDGFVVDTCTISHIANGIRTYSSGTALVVTFIDNTMSDFHGNAGNVDGINFGGSISDYDGSVVSGNDISGFADEAIDVYYAQNVIIRNNIIYDNVALNGGGSGNGIKAGGAAGAVHSTGHAIVRNYIHDLSNGGTNYGIGANSGSSVLCAYNKIHDCATGVKIDGLDSDGRNDNWEIYNNVLYGMSAYAILVNQGIDTDNRTTIAIRNNICDGSTKDIDIATWVTVTGGSNCLINDATATVHANSTYTGTDLGTTDPLFVDAANDDFTLQVGSLCIDNGIDVGLTQDYDGNAVGALPDIGAFELLGLIPPIFPYELRPAIIPTILPIIR